MFAADAPWLIVLGSLGGIAALLGAINTWIQRKHGGRITAFEAAQTSIQLALTRSDEENEKLRTRVDDQEKQIFILRAEIVSLSNKKGGI